MQFREIPPPNIEPLDIERATEEILQKLDSMRTSVYKAKHPKTVAWINHRNWRIRKLT
jgi:hypothetical protein